MAAGEGNLVLGIDIGTTSVKVCLVDPNSKQVMAKQTKDTQANVPSDLGSEGNKQDVPKIISALNSCVSRLPKDQLKQVKELYPFYIHFH
jgi:sedoheptulokinase